MSSILLHDLSGTLHVQSAKRFVVPNGRQALADYIERERAERGWSYGEIVRRSGDYIKSASTLVNVVNGNVTEVSENTMRGVAKAFGVEARQVFNIYYGSEGSVDPEALSRPPVEFRQLPDGDFLVRITPSQIADREAPTPREIPAGTLSVEQARLVEMYADIPAQCQKDVMDLLTVLQNNHSISRRRARLIEHRETVTRRRVAALSPHPPDNFDPERELLPGEYVLETADSLVEDAALDDSSNDTERERKRA
jgi:transcriptional regulator with XRE-family HTH domain